MGLRNFLGNLFRRKQNSISILEQQNRMRTFFARSIYSVPEVRTAINTVAETLAAVPIWRKRINNETGEVIYLNDNIDYLLNYSPNSIQNKAQFWSFIITKLLLNNTVAIEIVYDDDYNIIGLFPLPFSKARPQDDLKTAIFADDPSQKTYLLENIMILTRFSEFGRGTENHATDLYEQVIQAIQQRAIENTKEGARIVAAVKRSTQSSIGGRAKPGDTPKALLNDIKEQVEATDGAVKGFAYLSGAEDITPLNIPDVKIEKELLAIIIKAVYNYFGISQSIIDGTANELEFQQWIMKFPKFFCEQAQQELTRKLFTPGEVSHGNRIEFDYFALQISTLAAKVALMNNGALNGYLNQDECREYIGQPPLPDGLGKEYRGNLNTANLKIIDEYQQKKANQNGGFTENEK